MSKEPRRREMSESSFGGRERRSGRPWLLVALLALVIIALIVGAMILWRSLGTNLSGTVTTSDSVDTGADPKVTLTNTAGQISVEGVNDLRKVEFEATKHALGKDPSTAKQNAADVQVDIAREGGEVSLQTNGGRGSGADYVLRVPTGASVEVESEAGDVDVTWLNGAVSIVAEAGDVRVSKIKDSVRVEAPQGDVSVSEIKTDTGQTELEVGSGDVDLENLIVGTLEVSVESGDVIVAGRFSGNGRIFVDTGDITTRLPAEDARELTLEANVGKVEREDPKPSEES